MAVDPILKDYQIGIWFEITINFVFQKPKKHENLFISVFI